MKKTLSWMLSMVLIGLVACGPKPLPESQNDTKPQDIKEVVDLIRVFKVFSDNPPAPASNWTSGAQVPNPHPTVVQENFSPGDRMFVGISINPQYKGNVSFSKYTFFNKTSGQEKEIALPAESGTYKTGQILYLPTGNPWTVPNETGIYEIRLYRDDRVAASAVFEVKIEAVSIIEIFPAWGEFGVPPPGGWERIPAIIPHPTNVRRVFRQGDKMFLGMKINPQYATNVTFSKFTFFNQRTGQEQELAFSPRDTGPFEPGNPILIAIANPWTVPSQYGIYEVRLYRGNEVVASALFEVEIGPVVKATGNFRSDRYFMAVELPPGWAATEGPTGLARYFDGLVAFNSWNQSDFWARQVDAGNWPTYSPETIASQVPAGGAYVALVRTGGPPRPQDYNPLEYSENNLGGLWQPHDARQDGGKFITFYKWGRDLRLDVYCSPNASDTTAAELNALMKSWHFDSIPVGDPEWARTQARQLLPKEVNPLKFWATTANDGNVTRITEVELRGETVHFRFTYRWFGAPHPERSLGAHWWEIDVLPTGKAVLTGEGGTPLPW